MKQLIAAILLSLLYGCSCSEEVLEYTPTDMWSMAKAVEADIALVQVPNNEPHRRILCAHYAKWSDGCVAGSGKRIKVRRVELLVIQFESTEQAAKVAKGINQWYARNWVLDDVSNEPVLEDFVVKAFNAKRGSDYNDD